MNHSTAIAIVARLAAYLRANPQACDGTDGIARWWFDPQDFIDKEALDMALQELMHHGALEALVVGDRTCYRLADLAALDAAARAAATRGTPP